MHPRHRCGASRCLLLALKRPSAPPPEGSVTEVLPREMLAASSSLHDQKRSSAIQLAWHTPADHTGMKGFRPNLRVIKKNRFREPSTIDKVADALFGIEKPNSSLP